MTKYRINSRYLVDAFDIFLCRTYANLALSLVGARLPRPLCQLKSHYHKDLSARCVSPVMKKLGEKS